MFVLAARGPRPADGSAAATPSLPHGPAFPRPFPYLGPWFTLGQHSRTPSPDARKPSASKRRWTTVAVGAAVVAAASTTAWAAIGDDDSAKRAATTPNPPSAAPSSTKVDSVPEPANQGSPHQPPATSRPKSTRSPRPAETPRATGSSASARGTGARERTAKTVEYEAKKPKFRVLSSGRCGASYYGDPQLTASGERFNPAAMTAAHKTLPLGSKVRVTNPHSGESVTVRINDRGPYVGGRCLDLSRAAFAAIGNVSSGVMRVKYEVLAR